MRVLIVDDSASMRDRLITIISRIKTMDVICQMGNSLEAIDLVRDFTPDVITLDIQITSGRGIDLLRNIKKNKSQPIVIVFTNYTNPQYRKKCIEAGADYFFDKSSESEKLIEVLERLNREF